MDNLLMRQGDVLDAFKQLERNFGKDSASRKSREYIEERLNKLDRLWADFKAGNDKLAAYRDSDNPYFTNDQFEQTRAYYEAVRKKIASFPTKPSVEITGDTLNSPKPGSTTPKIQSGPMLSPAISTKQSNQVIELITLQRTHFRALKRLVNNLKVDEINVKWELEDELRNLQTRWNTIDTLHLQIDNVLQGTDTEYEDEFCYYEESYKAIKKALNQKMASTVHLQQSTPQLEVPNFSGSYTQWPTFCDLFSESIHNNNMLTKCQKMQHLKGKLKGQAERLIQHLNITTDNYDTAWELLNHRYNNPQLLFTNHFEMLLNQPSVQKQSASEIKRLYDTSMESIYAIQNLGVDTSTWDPALVHLITKKLDPETYTDYKEARKSPRALPSLAELMEFLEAKFTALEPVHKKDRDVLAMGNKLRQYPPKVPHYKSFGQNNQPAPSGYRYQRREFQSSAAQSQAIRCPFCSRSHYLYNCAKFLQQETDVKMRTIAKLQVCQNCLYKHNDSTCNSINRCKLCQGKHSTILHDAFKSMTSSSSGSAGDNDMSSPFPQSLSSPSKLPNNCNKQHHVSHVATDEEEILLTTVAIKVKAADGTYITLRALLDQGSQISLISEKATQLLGLQRQSFHASVSGIDNAHKSGRGIVSINCSSIYNDYSFLTQALVVSRVINHLPNNSFTKQQWQHLENITLADPDYNVSKPIDILLSAKIYSDIIMDGLVKSSVPAPIAQQTKLGWILSGSIKTFYCNVVINDLNEISKYWEIEDIDNSLNVLTPEDQYCEDLYQTTTKRLENGRYVVALPMKPNFDTLLGTSKRNAVGQFMQLERKMATNEQFSSSYKQFINEYRQLGHMVPVKAKLGPTCYLPHHGVLKNESTTTKLRVVFNGSAKTSSNFSLNDLMERGPNLQGDLLSLILKWRQYRYVITADIEKMFRNFYIRECDQPLQTVIWRDSPFEGLREYHLATVTYGTKAAPYLAIRTLRQLASDEETKYPLAAAALRDSFYMDDYMGGDDSIERTKELMHQLIQILKTAGMNLRKWSSNEPELVKDLSKDQLNSLLEFKCAESRKTLGLKWIPTSDSFTFESKIPNTTNDKITKRQLLSNIAKIYDPLGWLSPITIRAKLLFQGAWLLDLTWDDNLPLETQREWNQLHTEYNNIYKININRYLGNMNNTYCLHGFCDASEKVYACSIYIVTMNCKGEYTSQLVVAKTKLAPLKNKLTLPRLELSGALLLAQLMKKVIDNIVNKDHINIFAWTDSMVVLGWLRGNSSRWKQFISNRVKKITEIIPATSWHHVSSQDNAADCATRGLTSSQLLDHNLWWNGPQWLVTLDLSALSHKSYESHDIEVRKPSRVQVALCSTNETTVIQELLMHNNSLSRVAKILAWILRFIFRLRHRPISAKYFITPEEFNNAYNLLIKDEQSKHFVDDIKVILTKGYVNRKSKVASLSPFIDGEGLLRVGGRLKNSSVIMSARHQIILPSHSRFTDLVINQAHYITMHGGPRLTLSYIRNKFWIISGMRTVKRQLRRCVTCRRYSTESHPQIMADLPAPRVIASRPFTNTGVDFTGHFDVKANKGRGIRTHKGYIAVFVCLATKAIHLELVSDLSTPGFLAAFRRFSARRGTPQHVYSDNGTNFVGANRMLKKEYKEIVKTINTDLFSKISEMNIEWHFNAPAWPSAGGLWEAAVKSLKYHLKRVIGEQKLTYEEFITLLHQIEACLNSRPLCPLTENPEDDYLTPGHFLIGGPLLSRPQTDPEHINISTRWKLIQNMNKTFWKHWSSDYLQQLQTRSKWRTPIKNIKTDDIVLVKEENLPPGKWAMGRIVEVHPGRDGHVRVVSVKTRNGIIKRPILKLSLLPVYEA